MYYPCVALAVRCISQVSSERPWSEPDTFRDCLVVDLHSGLNSGRDTGAFS